MIIGQLITGPFGPSYLPPNYWKRNEDVQDAMSGKGSKIIADYIESIMRAHRATAKSKQVFKAK